MTGFHIILSIPAASPMIDKDTSPSLTTMWKPGLRQTLIFYRFTENEITRFATFMFDIDCTHSLVCEEIHLLNAYIIWDT